MTTISHALDHGARPDGFRLPPSSDRDWLRQQVLRGDAWQTVSRHCSKRSIWRRLELNLFRGTSPQVGWQRVFGGQVIGQALVAAIRTVDPARIAHSLHGYFMRPGDPERADHL